MPFKEKQALLFKSCEHRKQLFVPMFPELCQRRGKEGKKILLWGSEQEAKGNLLNCVLELVLWELQTSMCEVWDGGHPIDP